MNMIINESLRLYPPVLRIIRRVDRKVRLGLNLTLPANLDLCIPNLAVHHNPQMWGEDVHLFKPERFSDGVAKATNNNAAAYIPFGMGPRNCVGLNFATTQTKIALSMILQSYAFTLSPTYVHSPVHSLTLRPQQLHSSWTPDHQMAWSHVAGMSSCIGHIIYMLLCVLFLQSKVRVYTASHTPEVMCKLTLIKYLILFYIIFYL